MCRTVPIRSALESTDSGATIGGSRLLGTDLITHLHLKCLSCQKKKRFYSTFLLITSPVILQSDNFKSTDRLQVIGFRRLTHRSLRQSQYFPATLYDTFEGMIHLKMGAKWTAKKPKYRFYSLAKVWPDFDVWLSIECAMQSLYFTARSELLLNDAFESLRFTFSENGANCYCKMLEYGLYSFAKVPKSPSPKFEMNRLR